MWCRAPGRPCWSRIERGNHYSPSPLHVNLLQDTFLVVTAAPLAEFLLEVGSVPGVPHPLSQWVLPTTVHPPSLTFRLRRLGLTPSGSPGPLRDRPKFKLRPEHEDHGTSLRVASFASWAPGWLFEKGVRTGIRGPTAVGALVRL